MHSLHEEESEESIAASTSQAFPALATVADYKHKNRCVERGWPPPAHFQKSVAAPAWAQQPHVLLDFWLRLMGSGALGVARQRVLTGGLQREIFHINCVLMPKIPLLPSLFAAALLFSSGAGHVHASEQAKAADELSLFERYTNSAQDLILKGFELIGINYRFGGTNPDTGLDCSGFVQLVFKEAIGILLPRTAREQSEVGTVIDRHELKAGDLVFFNTMRHAFSHVGIYLGDNRFMHAPRTGAEVRIEDMRQNYWIQRYNGARRLLAR
ncbi:C40 family peptidase [Accumulibacter sp.]|uniref:C40 family peptidase n=1 Tax=Accumulibacter sp. TaxID=2053492 RepID=UPI00287A899F|nr:C40 family peptidase [Accumulibacter sp.]MDS4053494.1 C40 family peptidase [Accumulibacter sp.]